MNFKYILFLLFYLFIIQVRPKAMTYDKNFVVVIDPGHGGHDPGAIGRKGKEKNINLNVALKLGKLIKDNCHDTKVIYTRSSDKFVTLQDRAEIANKVKANLFISIHTNAVAQRNSGVRGTETYTLGLHRTQENLEVAKKENAVILIEDNYKQRYAGFNPNSSESYIIFEFIQDKNMVQSVDFATRVQRQFKNCNRIDKGVHQAGFLVLRETSMPSVLIELGYISNYAEETYLLSEKGTSELANSIYNAFVSYKGGQKGNLAQAAVTAKSTPEIKREEEKIEKENGNKPVFKIQILTSDRIISKNSRQFKGLSPVDYYKENGIIKYTFGESTDYNKILQLKKKRVDSRFKDAFIIAFKNGEKMNINKAIKEFKLNRK